MLNRSRCTRPCACAAALAPRLTTWRFGWLRADRSQPVGAVLDSVAKPVSILAISLCAGCVLRSSRARSVLTLARSVMSDSRTPPSDRLQRSVSLLQQIGSPSRSSFWCKYSIWDGVARKSGVRGPRASRGRVTIMLCRSCAFVLRPRPRLFTCRALSLKRIGARLIPVVITDAKGLNRLPTARDPALQSIMQSIALRSRVELARPRHNT